MSRLSRCASAREQVGGAFGRWRIGIEDGFGSDKRDKARRSAFLQCALLISVFKVRRRLVASGGGRSRHGRRV